MSHSKDEHEVFFLFIQQRIFRRVESSPQKKLPVSSLWERVSIKQSKYERPFFFTPTLLKPRTTSSRGHKSNKPKRSENLMEKRDEDLPQPTALRSPASTLPPEILSLIFQYAHTKVDLSKKYGLPELLQLSEPSPPSEKRTQFILSAVSAYWREVSMLLTPSLWTSVDLFISPSTVNEASAILQTFITCSGQLPLAIALEFATSWKYDTSALVDTSSDAVLYQNIHRIHQLHLFGLPDTWNDLLPSLTNLVHLSIRHSFSQSHPTVIKSRCSNLTLNPFPSCAMISCPEIVILHLHEAPVDSCLQALMACPNLTEFRVREPAEQGDLISLPTDPFVLPYMEVFEWSVNANGSTDVALLQHIRMPALKKLIWVEEIRDNLYENDPISIFFRNLPETLVDLHIHNATLDSYHSALKSVFEYPGPASVFDYARNLPNIECLTLSGIDSLFLDHVFKRLVPARAALLDPQKMELSKLKTIRLKGTFILTQYIQQKIQHMLECRFNGVGPLGGGLFRLELPSAVAWSPSFKRDLKENIRRGLKVEIFEGSELASWLSTGPP